MRARLFTATLGLAATIAVLGAGAATAAPPPPTNGGATHITSTTATLNGTIDTTDPADGDSFWYFEWGTTTKYGQHSPAVVFGPKQNGAVTFTASGLTPNTTYHFRLVVADNVNYSPAYSPSVDDTFTTLTKSGSGGSGGSGGNSGRASLTSHRLKVQSGYVSIPFKCAGSAGTQCKGAVIIAATGKLGNAKKKTMYGCAGGSFSTAGGKTKTLHMKVSKSCTTLLAQAQNHQLKATLRATYSTHQPSLKTVVTLVG